MEYHHEVARGDIKSKGDGYRSAHRRQTYGVYMAKVVNPCDMSTSSPHSHRPATRRFVLRGRRRRALGRVPVPCGAASTCAGAETSVWCTGFCISVTGSRSSSVADVDAGTRDNDDDDAPSAGGERRRRERRDDLLESTRLFLRQRWWETSLRWAVPWCRARHALDALVREERGTLRWRRDRGACRIELDVAGGLRQW